MSILQNLGLPLVPANFNMFPERSKSVFVVKFQGQRVSMVSGKSSWNSKGTARSAITNTLEGVASSYNRKKPPSLPKITASELRKALEDANIITIEAL